MSHATGIAYLKEGVLPHMWCSGCGIGVMLGAMLRAFEELGYRNADTVVVTGIGCTGKADDYLGDPRPSHDARPRAGLCDGDQGIQSEVACGRSDGGWGQCDHRRESLHSCRKTEYRSDGHRHQQLQLRNDGGQVSATTPGGRYTSTTSWGNPERDFDICALAEVAGANYVARETPYHGWE